MAVKFTLDQIKEVNTAKLQASGSKAVKPKSSFSNTGSSPNGSNTRNGGTEKSVPLYQKILDRLTVKDSNDRSWLNKGLLEDGVDKDDIWKTILASLSDAGEDILAGGLNLGESLADTSAMLLPALLEVQQKLNSKLGVAPTAEDIRILEEAKAKALAFKQKDLYDGNAVAREILSNLQSVGYMEGRGGYISEEDIAESQRLKAASKKYMDEEMESVSVLGEKLDSAAQSAGQLAVRTAVNAYVPGAGWILAASSAFDDEVDNAIEEGANFEEMMTSGAISAAAEVGIEALSGGIKIGDKAATDFLVDKLAALIPKSVLRTGMKLGIEATGEGIEEVLTDAVSKFGQWLTYRSEEELKDIFSSEQALDAASESFWSGLLMGGAFGTANVAQSHAAGTDFVSGLTKNEETVVRKLVNDRLAEAKKNNEKVKKSDVYNEVIEAMDRGEISIDTIEEMLGGKSYRDYKLAMDSKEDNDFLQRYDTLPSENAQYTEMTERAKQIKENRSNLQGRLRQEVSQMVKGDRLSESYNQKALRGVGFKVDLNKVDAKQKAIYQKAMDSGVINDTRRSHEFVDLVAKIASDKGVDFDFTNNERIKQSGFAVEGAHVNGYVNENGITINMQSAKALNTVVGHEITHVLEGTGLYDALQQAAFDYAKSKGELTDRWKATKALYKDLNAVEINKEITADLVGDYLFGDKDFVNTLYSGNRNIFEKIYDEVKYLCKVVTAGSKEARQLEKVKKAFADAYHVDTKTESGMKYSLAEIVDENQKSYGIGVHLDSTLLEGLSESERVEMVKEYVKELGGDSFTAFDPNGKPVDISIAEYGEKFVNHSGQRTRVNKDLIGKYNKNQTKQESIVLIDEMIAASAYKGNGTPRYPHGWVDNKGKNQWEYWTTFVQDKNNTIWEATLNVANSADGRKILYDISPIKKAGRAAKSAAIPAENNVSQSSPNVNTQHSLSPENTTPAHRGDYNITSEEAYFDANAIGPVGENITSQTAKYEPVSNSVELDSLPPKDRAKKFFFDEVMSFDKMPEGFRKKHGEKWTALQRATENAQNLVVHGADGVKPLDDIYQRVVDTGAFSRFELYMQHLLNMDAMSLNQRFGLKNMDVIGGVSAEMSRQEAAKLEKAHPEFKELSQDVYDFYRFLRNVLVQSGKITQETADLWEQRYPHYIAIKRMGFGNDTEITDLLSFMVENMEQVPNAENMDGFFRQVEGTAPVKARKGSDLPIQPLFDTMTERAMQTYWTAAMNDADMRKLAPVRSDVAAPDHTSPAPAKSVAPENVQIETEKSSGPKILDVDNEDMRKGKMNPIKWLEEFVLDNGMVFERLAKKTKDRGLEAEWNFVRNARGAAQHLIGNGDQSKGVKALKDLFAEVQKTGSAEQFYEYLGHQRNLDSMTMRVRFGLPANQTIMGRSAADSLDALFEMNKDHPEFKDLAEQTYQYSQNLLDHIVESGMIAQSDADMIREIAPHWIPFNTVEGKIQPVFTTLAQETLKIQHQIALNKFGVHLKNTLGTVVSESSMNMREFMNSIEKGGNLVQFGGNNRFHTMTVLDNGKAVTFEITDEMYTALKPTNDILSVSLPVLSQANTLRRNLITAYSPWFTAKNAIRDVQEIVINSQHPVKTYATIPQAVNELWNKGAYYQEYVKNGGEQNTYFDSESGEFGSGKGIMDALEGKAGLRHIIKANNFIESVPRLAEYIASREAGASVEVAMLDAARVTTNFAAGGKLTKAVDRNGATFLNASVQGALQQARNFAEAKQNGFKGWASLAARYAALGLPAVLLNNLIWDDDEEYQELPDYITNNYYIIGKYGEGSFVRIPKGRVAAVIQNAVEQVSSDNGDWHEFWKLVGENIAPNNPLDDNIFAPVVQVAKNKTWYDEDLVPRRLQKIDDVTQRFDEKTSSWSIWLSNKLEDSFLGDHVDLSPKQIHYLMDQYSGVLGDTILPFLTPKAESPTDSFVGKMLAPVRDIFTTDSTLNNRVTGDFYDTLEAVQAEAQAPGSSRSAKLQDEILSSYNFRINDLLQKQRDLQTSDLKDSEKYRQNRQLKEQINALQKEALDTYQKVRITGLYAEAAGKRFNYGFNKKTGLNEWFEIKPKDADGTDNWYYQMEQGATKTFGLSPAEFWNNREEYSAAYKVASHYDEPYFETVKNVLGLEEFAEYAVGLSQIYADKDAQGNSISGTKKKKVKEYIYSLDIPDIEKHILYRAEYNSENKGQLKTIRKYLNSLDLTSYELNSILSELGMY